MENKEVGRETEAWNEIYVGINQVARLQAFVEMQSKHLLDELGLELSFTTDKTDNSMTRGRARFLWKPATRTF
jgi:hypothetical protein